MTLQSLETYDRIVIRLKAIKYKEDFFHYLSFYFLSRPRSLNRLLSNPIFQAVCF